MKSICVAVAILIFPIAAWSADDGMAVWKEWKPDVEKAARAYVAKFSTAKDQKKWNDWINERCETRALETVALDWFFDNEVKLREKDPEKIKQACFLFIKLVETDTLLPCKSGTGSQTRTCRRWWSSSIAA